MARRAAIRVSPPEQAEAERVAAALALPVGDKLAVLHQRRPDLFNAFVADLLELRGAGSRRG